MNNQIPYFGAYGYVPAPAKSINWGAALLLIIVLVSIGLGIYYLFISEEKKEKDVEELSTVRRLKL